jgi:hypothetical protein
MIPSPELVRPRLTSRLGGALLPRAGDPADPGTQVASSQVQLRAVPAALTGRASKGIAGELRHHGFDMAAPPESFVVTKDNHLGEGEGARARAWGARLAAEIARPSLTSPGSGATPVQLIEIALGGLLLGLLRVASGALWMAIGFHAAWDFVENGVVKTRLLPQHGPVLEQTAAGWIVPLLIIVALLVILARRHPPLNWKNRPAEAGELRPAAAAPQPAS